MIYIEQIVNYIKKNLSKGYTLDSLKFALFDQGYSKSSIERAIQIVNKQLAKKAPILKEKPVIRIERIPIYNDLPEEETTESFWDKIKKIFS